MTKHFQARHSFVIEETWLHKLFHFEIYEPKVTTIEGHEL